KIERIGPLSVCISGPASLFKKKFGVKFEHRESEALEAQDVTPPLTPTLASAAKLLDTGIPEVEGVVFPQPIALHAPARRPAGPPANPPRRRYYHLAVPRDIVTGMNAGPVHREGYRGENVRAAMIDSGFGWTHPYFTSKGYDVEVALPAGSDRDAEG